MKNKIIAVDFDGTLCENGYYPEAGPPIIEVINRLKMEATAGAKIILWTCRVGEALDFAVAWCHRYGIRLDAVNANLPECLAEWNYIDNRKVFAHEYWDDKAVNVEDLK
mgnify:FL=1